MSKTKARLHLLLNRIQAMERVPRLAVWLVQLSIFVLSGLAAFLLRFDFTVPAPYFQYFIWALPIWLIVKAVVFRVCGLDRGWWRFVSIHDVFRIGAGNLLGSSASAVLNTKTKSLSLPPVASPSDVFVPSQSSRERSCQDIRRLQAEVRAGVLPLSALDGPVQAAATLQAEVRAGVAPPSVLLGASGCP